MLVLSLGWDDPQEDPLEDPLKWAWQPTSAFLPGESHGQRSLVGYSPQSCKESDTTEVRKCMHAFLSLIHITLCLSLQ